MLNQESSTISVVVCAYTLARWEDITAAVASLREQTRRPDQVLLVSDHNPELLDRARAAFPDVTCLPNTGPQGLSGARNTGVAAATGDVVAFLDDDAAAGPDWVAAMLEAYRDDDVIGVGGAVLPGWRAPRPAWFPDEFLWVVGCSYTGQPTTRAEIRNPIGANMSFRRSTFASAGGFDVDMGRLGADAAGCEETEFAIRARRTQPGGRVVLEPGARCLHNVSPDRVTRRYFRRRCLGEGRSKAVVSRLTGTDAALASELTYVRHTLPQGVLRGLRDAVHGDRAGAARAVAIVEGLTLTAASYVLARGRQTWQARRTRPRTS
ncbi:glycosyltransferase family 2 protein [Modestobacter sp. VKM Ac-2986]|uniref:glycosyltransferase family 2 protein n=1 Tax=Modestobacter sp. VKM Ac-2986 TaxID=3004140 RepID=UPI0022AB8A8C|nr:glycosyltransferase family 2 protein [Modestobacter sp. VKM Ac-2986]MCZ2829864.1 glycosyltransferase family 2 protein [Modestobacter sp. VKM Ac-2986]